MISSSQIQQSMQKELINMQSNKLETKKIKNFKCPCSKSYSSYAALFSHIKIKHQGKAPGEVIKPNPQRKRGRPYKIQVQRNNINNSHYMSSNFNQLQKKNLELYPFKQYAQMDNTIKQNFIRGYSMPMGLKYSNCKQNISNQQKNQHFGMFYNHSEANFNFKNNSSFINRQHPNQYMTNSYKYNQNTPFFIQNKSINNLPYRQGYNIHQNQPSNNFKIKNPFLQNNFEQNFSQFNNPNITQPQPYIQNLTNQMKSKFGPIQNGITLLLEPILTDIYNLPSSSQHQLQNQNPNQFVILNNQKQTIRQNFQQKQKKNQSNDRNKQIFQTNSNFKQPSKKNFKIKISQIIKLDFFNQIAKWMIVYPTIQNRNIDFLQYGFRWAIIDFLHYLQKFLQSDQNQQVFLVLIFLSDHILHKTKDFTLRGQPKIYQLALYFTSFIDEYIPKMIQSINGLEEYYLFSRYHKRLSELFLWMSCWMSMQQYHHNKYFRQKTKFELTQQCYKHLIYQRDFTTYINEALKRNSQIKPFQQQIQQKVQQYPQPHYIQALQNKQINKQVESIELYNSSEQLLGSQINQRQIQNLIS